MVITLKKSRFFPSFFLIVSSGILWGSVLFILGYETLFSVLSLSIGVGIIQLLLLLYILMDWKWETYEIENDSLTHIHGVFVRQKEIHALENINTIAVRQNLIGMFFGFGNIRLYSPFSEEPYRIKGIPNPFQTAEDIEKIIPGEIPIKNVSPELFKKPDRKKKE